MFPLLLAQITPAQQTIVNQVGQEFFIQGGGLNGTNLFHSFQQFGLTQEQIATFMANPELENILVRVVNRRDPSFIDGLLQISGGSPNLFFINPAGVVFGENAQVNVPASFIVGTSTAIDFPDARWSTSTLGGNTSALPPSDLVFSFIARNPVINLGQIVAGEQVFFAGRNVQSIGSVTARDFTAVTLGTSIFTFAVGLDSGQTRTTLTDTSFIRSFDWEDFNFEEPPIGDVVLKNLFVESSLIVDSGRAIVLEDSQASQVSLRSSRIAPIFVENVDAVALTADGWEVSIVNFAGLPDIFRCGVPDCWDGIRGYSGNIPVVVLPPEPEPPIVVDPPDPEPELPVVVNPPDLEPEPPVVVDPPDPEPEPPVVIDPPNPEPELPVVIDPPDPEPELLVVVNPPGLEPEPLDSEPEFQSYLPAVSDFVQNPQPDFLKTEFYFSQTVNFSDPWCLGYDYNHLGDRFCLLQFRPPGSGFPQEMTESQFSSSLRELQ
ncbi:MAG: filamentous hemagglutinin N-terminal domain-containing protein [Coleofasciculus sp. G1-WW12-02]|uniref:two-partner secretion domain-containing protein n=1 Tax=Coleofasciculus sp. G1-WW12-02 TaxID=3068483 RepID=UPI0032FB78B3